MKIWIAAALLAVVACSKKSGSEGGGGGGDTETVPLGSTGFVIDVPSGTKVESPMAGFYELKGHGHPQIMESHSTAQSADEIVKTWCEGRTDVQKGTLTGGAWVTCKGESKMMKGVTTTKIIVNVAKDAQSGFDCHLETDQDPAEALAICKSIRKK
jgi:hypothetical protein